MIHVHYDNSVQIDIFNINYMQVQGLFRSVRDTTEILQGGKYIVCLTGCKICDNC